MNPDNYEFIYVKPDELKPYPTNSKIHSADAIDELAESIKMIGFNRPIVIDDTDTILAGHKSVKAALKLGIEKIPAYRPKELTDAVKKAFVLAENKQGELSEWDFDLVSSELEALQEMDFDIDLTGFGTEELEDMIDYQLEENNTYDSQPAKQNSCPHCGGML